MAISKVRHDQLLIMVEDGADNYVHHCLINLDRSFSKSTNWNTEEIPDCDNPDNPATTVRTATSKDFTFTGSGKVDGGSVDFYDTWQDSAEKKNVKIVLNPATGGLTWTGKGGLESFEVTGSFKNHCEVSVSGFLEDYTKAVNA